MTQFQSLRRSLPLIFTLVMLGCSSPAASDSARSESAPEPSTTSRSDAPQIVPVQPLTPQSYRIELADLPEPYATDSARKSPQVVPIPEDATLAVPDGFTVTVFAEGLDRPRWLALTPEGDVLVTETRQNRIRRLQDTNADGVADEITTFADADNQLDIPFGMTFAQGFFFLGNTDEVRRYVYESGQARLLDEGEKIADLPGGGYNQHWTRNVISNGKGDSASADLSVRLYVSIGSKSNVAEEDLPRASVQVMNLDGSNMSTWATGLRNPVGLAVHPITQELYTTVNERDGLGDDLVPDYFTRIQVGDFFGWPWAYLTPELLDPRHVRQGRSTNPQQVAQTQLPDVLFQSHSAALGVQFYTGETFPEKYQNGAFVAFRGSWNRDRGTGYKIVFVPFDADHRPTGDYEDFLTGFLLDPDGPTTWGRPVGVLVLPDGSLLFTEEANGRIYRVQYEGEY